MLLLLDEREAHCSHTKMLTMIEDAWLDGLMKSQVNKPYWLII